MFIGRTDACSGSSPARHFGQKEQFLWRPEGWMLT